MIIEKVLKNDCYILTAKGYEMEEVLDVLSCEKR